MEGQMIEYEFGRSTSVLIFGFVGLFFEGLLSWYGILPRAHCSHVLVPVPYHRNFCKPDHVLEYYLVENSRSGRGGEKNVVKGELLSLLGYDTWKIGKGPNITRGGSSGNIALSPIIRVSMAPETQVKACALKSRNADSSPSWARIGIVNSRIWLELTLAQLQYSLMMSILFFLARVYIDHLGEKKSEWKGWDIKSEREGEAKTRDKPRC